MYKRVVLIAVIFIIVFGVSAQESNIQSEIGLKQQSFAEDNTSQRDQNLNMRNYSINFSLRIFDHENNPLVDSSWNRITRSGQPVSVNLRANNLKIAVLFIPYFIDENSVMLLSQSKVVLRYANHAGGRYYSAVDSIPLRIGEKALFFPLGIFHEKVENISSCVLEIEVLYHEDE